MDKVLSDMIQALKEGKCKLILLVGPAGVGKTTTLLWLYKKLEKLKVSVLPLTQRNKENVNIKDFCVLMMDLHDLQCT